MPDIQYSESPNETTAFVVDGDRKNRAVLTAAQDTSTIEYPSNPNSTKAYVTVDGKKHRVVMIANIAGGGSGGGAVDSVNGQTGTVVLNASDVGAVPQYTTLPEASENIGKTVQYVGTDTDTLTHNYFYESKATDTGYSWQQVNVQPASSGGENINWVAKADLETGENPTMILRITGGLPDGEYEFYTQVKNNYYESSYSIGYITCKVLLKLTTEQGSQYPICKATICPVIDGNWAYKSLLNFASGQTVYFVDGDVVITCGLDLFMSNIPNNTGYSLAVEDCYKVSEFINTATNEKYTPQIEFNAPETYDYITSVMFQTRTIDQMPDIPMYFTSTTDNISSAQYVKIAGMFLNDNRTMDIDVNLACGFDSFQAHIHLYGNGIYKITKQKATGVFENTQFVSENNYIFVKLNAPVGATGSLYIRVGISNSNNSLWISTTDVPSTETLLNITEIGGTVDNQNIGDILQYTGTTNASYINGYFYKATGTVVTIPESVTISEESPSDWTVSLNVSVSDLITAIMNATGWSDPEWIKQYVLTNGGWRIDVDASDNNNITNVYIANYGDVSSGAILSCFSATTTGSYFSTLNVYFRCTYNAEHQEVQGGAWTRIDTQPAGTTLTSITGTLVAANWSSNTQTISVQGVTSSNIIIVGAAPSSQSDYTSGGVICTAQGTDSLTFTCTQTPTNDITVNVIFD